MNFINHVLVRYNTPYYRPVIAVSYSDSRIKLGGVADAALPFTLEEAKALHRKLVLFGYDALIWSGKGLNYEISLQKKHLRGHQELVDREQRLQ